MLQHTSTTVLALCVFLSIQFGRSSLAQEQANKYVDDKYDFSLTVPGPWKNARLQDYTVPGVARVAYAGTGGSSIVVFVQEPGQAFAPRFLVDESAKSLEKNLGATIREKDVRSVAGKKAMWLIFDGKGTGGAVDGKGLVKTTQHWVAIPREKDVVVFLLTSPTAEFEDNEKSFGKVIEALTVGGSQTEDQRASE